MKARLIDDWRNAWKWLSVNAMVAAASIQGVWIELPSDMKSSLPPNVVNYLTIALLVLGVYGRITTKKAKPDASDEEPSA